MDTHYISLDEILSKNKVLNFVLGMSLGGKTYKGLKLAIGTWRRKKARTIICVRNEIQVSSDLIDGLAAEIDKITTASNWALGALSISGSGVDTVFSFGTDKPFLSFKSLHTVLSKKQTTIPNVAWILFDEFVLNTRSGERYLTDEIMRFKWLFSKTTRGYDYKTRVLFLGNTESAYNPYFAEYGIKPSFLTPNKISSPKNENWAVELWINKERMKEISAKGLDKVLGGEYGRYAFGGSFLNDRSTLYIPSPLPKSRPSLSFYTKDKKLITVWKNESKTVIRNGGGSTVCLAVDNLSAIEGRLYAGLSNFKPIINGLKIRADCGQLYFENAQAENYFFEIYNEF